MEVNKTIESDFNEYQVSWSKKNDFDLEKQRKEKHLKVKKTFDDNTTSIAKQKKLEMPKEKCKSIYALTS